MIYIYDILVNFCDNDLVYDFYEWLKSDNIENIKRIKLIHINKDVYDDLLNYECIVDKDLLTKIYRSCEVYKSKRIKVLDYSVLVSDGSRVMAIEFDNNGNIVYKSKLLLDEEDEIAMLANNIELYDINYKKNKKILDNRFFTRKELIIRNYLYSEIEDSYINKNYDKLRFLYQEVFDKDGLSYIDMKNDLLNSIKDNISDKHKELFNLLKISTKKKQV